ncbi:hypothetical protein [Criibacterium bergeronii]|uniref:Uncharacterized protein n=1 Tax=Criibacterium bergeronii TaxID=1871336 RepID=A0A371IKF9_9FIRM|nr:hypothetical protein [Criibacterium bergeronii]MBS6062831.1 hypothetical protein [Peptostreptococcaceae bacterium]RDY20982.1 hypothetical protein BBG48_007190 [Criibacterium bergeronii]TRW27699.1 hypothetical protein FL857_03775 [Criibacterium bergeronii]
MDTQKIDFNDMNKQSKIDNILKRFNLVQEDKVDSEILQQGEDLNSDAKQEDINSKLEFINDHLEEIIDCFKDTKTRKEIDRQTATGYFQELMKARKLEKKRMEESDLLK